jgi:hypothetical protein
MPLRRDWPSDESRCERVRRRSCGRHKRCLPFRQRPRDGRDRPSVLRKRGRASSVTVNSRRAQPLDGASTVPGGEDDKFVNYWSDSVQSQGKIVQRTPTRCGAVSFLGITLSGQLRIGFEGIRGRRGITFPRRGRRPLWRPRPGRQSSSESPPPSLGRRCRGRRLRRPRP